MKTLRAGLLLLLVLHLLAAAGFAAWLGTSGRLSRGRLKQTANLFKLTVAEEARQTDLAQKLEEETRAKAEDAARLERVGQGPPPLAERLAGDEQRQEIALQRVERMQREKEDLVRQLQAAKDLIAKQQADLEGQRREFAEARAAEVKLRDDRDFRQAVEMYEQLRPKQAKEMFQDLLRKKQEPQVVDYLAAMQLRKAAAVLKEFKTPEEVAQATGLVQRLRARGVEVLSPSGPARTGMEAGAAGSATQPGSST